MARWDIPHHLYVQNLWPAGFPNGADCQGASETSCLKCWQHQWYIQPMEILGNIQVISKSSAPTIQQILMKHDLFNLSWLVNLPSPNVTPPEKKKKGLNEGGGRLIRNQSWSLGSFPRYQPSKSSGVTSDLCLGAGFSLSMFVAISLGSEMVKEFAFQTFQD